MRKVSIVEGEYYHVYNRGNNKRDIFLKEEDWARFLFLILFFQSSIPVHHVGKFVSRFVKHRVFDISKKQKEKLIANRFVELNNFALMPNHFHLTVRNLTSDGLSKYMQRVLNAYTKYFNAKYGISGHLFQGPFQVVAIKDDRQLLHLSAYIHKNPCELKRWRKKEHIYPWSSYQDYLEPNRWDGLLAPEIILGQFENSAEYREFIKTSPAKEKFLEEFLFA